MCQYHCVLPVNHPGIRTKASLNSSCFIHLIHDSNNWDAEMAQCGTVWECSPPTNVAQVQFQPGTRFSKALETFQACKAILYYENLCHIKNMRIKQPCNHKVWDFATAFRVRKVSWAFKKLAPGAICTSSLLFFLALLWGFFLFFFSSLYKNQHLLIPILPV